MFAFSKLFAAVGSLAEGLATLTSTVGEINSSLRQRLHLDQAEEGPALIDHEPGATSRRGKGKASE